MSPSRRVRPERFTSQEEARASLIAWVTSGFRPPWFRLRHDNLQIDNAMSATKSPRARVEFQRRDGSVYVIEVRRSPPDQCDAWKIVSTLEVPPERVDAERVFVDEFRIAVDAMPESYDIRFYMTESGVWDDFCDARVFADEASAHNHLAALRPLSDKEISFVVDWRDMPVPQKPSLLSSHV